MRSWPRLAGAALGLLTLASGCAAVDEIRDDRSAELSRLCVSIVERRAGRGSGDTVTIDRTELEAIAGFNAFEGLFDDDRVPAYSGASALRRLCRPTADS